MLWGLTCSGPGKPDGSSLLCVVNVCSCAILKGAVRVQQKDWRVSKWAFKLRGCTGRREWCKNNNHKTKHGRRDTAWPSARWCHNRKQWRRNEWWMDPVWMVSGRHAANAFQSIRMGIGCFGGCWGALPACGEGGDPGPRGWWQGGPLSSSPPPGPGSAVQTAPPAPWLTPAEPPRSHTAPYTL